MSIAMQFVRNRFPRLYTLMTPLRIQKYYMSLRFRSPERVFGKIYREFGWGNGESISGLGSSLAKTEAVRAALPALLREFGCTSLVDAPCGDFNWMQHVSTGVQYIGCDIVADLIDKNRQRYARSDRSFIQCNLIEDRLPAGDLLLCRDCLVHLSHRNVTRALKNIQASGTKYLLTTTFPQVRRNGDIPTGAWRALNLTEAPFNLPPPIRLIAENDTLKGYEDKSLGLWRVSDIP